MEKKKEHSWLWGLLFAVIFFVVIGIIANQSENSLESGEQFGSIILPLLLVGVGIYFGVKYFNKKKG